MIRTLPGPAQAGPGAVCGHVRPAAEAESTRAEAEAGVAGRGTRSFMALPAESDL